MKRSKVAIITPTFNHERFIAQCIESMRAQTFTDWTACIVDDGSTDRTAEIAKSIHDDRIKVISQPHKGLYHLAESYNLALQETDSDLVAILEGDDYWPEDKLATQVPDFDDPDVVLSSGRFTAVRDSDGFTKVKPDILPSDAALVNEPVGEAFLALFHLSHLTFTWPVATVIRRRALEAIGGFWQPPNLPIVDLPTFAKLAFQGRFAYHKDQSLGFWRRHGASASSTNLAVQLGGVHHLLGEMLVTPEAAVLSSERINELDDLWASNQVHRLVLLARILSRDGRKNDARTALLQAKKFRSGPKRRAKIQVGLSAMSMGIPLESVYPNLGMGNLEDQLKVAGVDSLVEASLFESMPIPLDLVAAHQKIKKSDRIS